MTDTSKTYNVRYRYRYIIRTVESYRTIVAYPSNVDQIKMNSTLKIMVRNKTKQKRKKFCADAYVIQYILAHDVILFRRLISEAL